MVKEPNPNCEFCGGTGIISMNEALEHVHFPDVECECTKEES